jgi:hypothetical protein
VADILEILLEIFQFNKAKIELHSYIFREHLVLLISDAYLPLFIKRFTPLLNYFISADHANGAVVLDAIRKYWPRTRLSKQVQLLSIMTGTIPHVSQRDFASRIPKLIPLYADATCSPASKLAEAGLRLWHSLETQAIIIIYARQVFPLIVPALIRCSTEHWSLAIRQSASHALAVATKTDPKLISDGSVKIRVSDVVARWTTVVNAASATGVKIPDMANLDRIFKGENWFAPVKSLSFHAKLRENCPSIVKPKIK